MPRPISRLQWEVGEEAEERVGAFWWMENQRCNPSIVVGTVKNCRQY